MTQAEQPSRISGELRQSLEFAAFETAEFRKFQDTLWERFLASKVQPSRAEGAELELYELEEGERRLAAHTAQPKSLMAEAEWNNWALVYVDALLTALRQAQAQAERDELLAEEYRNAIRSLQAQGEQLRLRPIYRLSMVQDLTKQKEALEAENVQLRASLEAVNELLSECVAELERLNKDHPLYEPTATTRGRAWLEGKKNE